jgi:tRNA A37 threonylcarbamoyladenosine modification protein TsaB
VCSSDLLLKKKIIFTGKDFNTVKDKVKTPFDYKYQDDYSAEDMLDFAVYLACSGKSLNEPEPVYLRKSEAEIALLKKTTSS